jgi:hypothetical protein
MPPPNSVGLTAALYVNGGDDANRRYDAEDDQLAFLVGDILDHEEADGLDPGQNAWLADGGHDPGGAP